MKRSSKPQTDAAKDAKSGERQPRVSDGPVGTATSTAGTVQLVRNFKGRQVGETFKFQDAKRLGLLEHCKPFAPNKK